MIGAALAQRRIMQLPLQLFSLCRAGMNYYKYYLAFRRITSEVFSRELNM